MKKGFTLIELLAVIIVLALIALISVPLILEQVEEASEKKYFLNENAMKDATSLYLVTKDELLPKTKTHSNIVSLTDLISNDYIKPIKVSNTLCQGYAVITKIDDVEIKPYLKCGDYETVGYNNLLLSETTLLNIEYLIVAGGGGGGYRHGAGGGAGGLIHGEFLPIKETKTYDVKVGSGGLGASLPSIRAQTGEDSLIENLVSQGGGGGGQHDSFPTGLNGGSGGGSSNNSYSLGKKSQGNKGGINNRLTTYYFHNHGGGGGAATIGTNGTIESCGDGGVGIYFPQFSTYGENGYFAGGGGGGSHNPQPQDNLPGQGGLGGGGNSGLPGIDNPGEDGLPNTGGGGGGASTYGGGNSRGGNGGSGIVIIRYIGVPIATGGTITTKDGYTIHSFTETGQFTFRLQ